MVLGSPKLEKHQVCYAKTCKELLSVPPCYPVTAQPLRLGGCMKFTLSGGGAISPDVQVGENHPTAEGFRSGFLECQECLIQGWMLRDAGMRANRKVLPSRCH